MNGNNRLFGGGKPYCSITSDIDTLESIYKGQDCARGSYSYAEFAMGLEKFADVLARYKAPATLFMVGRDFQREADHQTILDMHNLGHEIANHSTTHPQGFRHLSLPLMEQEIAEMEESCLALTGRRPVGFRSPGWNVDDQALEILKRRGYTYESSVFPTTAMPLMKLLHWWSQRNRSTVDRSTMGPLRYLCAPTLPYRTGLNRLDRPGEGGLVEFPVTVTPVLRFPFFATVFASTGLKFFHWCLKWLLRWGWPIQFQFHLSDFLDYHHPALIDQVPHLGAGQYVPKSLSMTLDEKMELFLPILDALAENYQFVTLENWAQEIA